MFLIFSSGIRKRAQDTVQSVQWKTPWGDLHGDNVIVGPIAPDAEHRYFSYEATANIIKRDFDMDSGQWMETPLERKKHRQRLLAFAKQTCDEWFNTERGRYSWRGLDREYHGEYNPPNWFDDRPKHWGSTIPGMNERDGDDHIVHFVADLLLVDRRSGLPIGATFDWRGDWAPSQHRNAVAYRGRIYVFSYALWEVAIKRILEVKGESDTLIGSKYGLRTDLIDFTAVVIAHEMAHRELFLRAWDGFTDDHIGSPDNWLPGQSDSVDKDKDYVKDTYEDNAGSPFKFDSSHKYAILRWWTGDPNRGPEQEQDTKDPIDFEMYAQLWGENRYLVGSLVIKFNQRGEPVVENGKVSVVDKDWAYDGWLNRLYPFGLPQGGQQGN